MANTKWSDFPVASSVALTDSAVGLIGGANKQFTLTVLQAALTKVGVVTVTQPATAATLTIADNKTLTVSNTLTFTGTDSSSVAFGAGGTAAYAAATLTANRILLGNGTSSVTPLGSLGTTTTVLHGNASGAPTFGAVDLANDVTGALPVVINAQTGTSYTVIAGDQNKLVTLSNGSAVAVTLPQATGSFGSGWATTLLNLGAGTVTITPTTSTVNGGATVALTTGQSYSPVSDGTNYNGPYGSLGSGSGANAALSNLASVAINSALVLGTSDGAALGSTTKQWSDLFLAEGGVINWDNGDATLTQTNNDITFAGITTFGVGTSTAVTLGSIELGHDSDTTIARVSAGVASIEGKNIALNGTGETLTTGTIELGAASDTTLARASAGVVSVEGVNLVNTNDIANTKIAAINFVIDGGGATITTGVKGDLEIPFACTINRVTLLADQSGSIVVDVWKDTYANFPPTGADSICASAKPTITSATKSQDSTLTGWTTSVSAGDTLRFNVDSITTCQRVTLSLKVTKT